MSLSAASSLPGWRSDQSVNVMSVLGTLATKVCEYTGPGENHYESS